MFVEVQDSVKKELLMRFTTKDFSWINNIFPEKEEDEEEQKER